MLPAWASADGWHVVAGAQQWGTIERSQPTPDGQRAEAQLDCRRGQLARPQATVPGL